MNIRRLLKPTLISIIPAFFVWMNVDDIITVFEIPSAYGFGTELGGETGGNPLYSSKEVYLIYQVVFTIILLLSIYFAFANKKTALYFSLALSLLLLVFPAMMVEP